MKKAAISGGRLHTSGHFVPKPYLCKGVRIVDVIIIEDVLVLACEPIVRHSHGIHLTQLVRPGPDELCEVYAMAVPDDGLTSEDEDILNYDDIDDPDAFA